VFTDYGANVRFDTGLGSLVAIPAPPAGKVRLWSSQFAARNEGPGGFRGWGANPGGLGSNFDGQLKFAGFPVGAPLVGASSVDPPLVSQFYSAPGEDWELDVSAYGGGGTGISWAMFWRDYAGITPARVAPAPGGAVLIPAPAAGRVRVLVVPGIGYDTNQPVVQIHNRDTIIHNYSVSVFYPGLGPPVQSQIFAPANPGDMTEGLVGQPVLGEGAVMTVEQVEATVTTPSMAFACYQDLPLTP
jgi:hypothetical protein